MKKLIFPLIALSLVACDQPKEKEETAKKEITLKYPETKKVDTLTNYFGTDVKDPYRWLEDDKSKETEAWVKEENKVTFEYLNQIPYRDTLKQRLSTLWNYEKVGAPYKEGDYTYFSKNDGLQNQYVVYRYKTGEDASTAEVFLDPNKFSEDGTTSLGGMSFSENGKILAYAISEGGSDWRKVMVMNVETKEITEDTLVDVKFSGMSWKGNEGFFYSSYDKPEGSELSAKTDQHKLYYHQLNTPQKEDQLIFGGTEAEKHRYVGGSVTEDNKYLLIRASVSTSGNKLFLKDLNNPNAALKTIIGNTDTDTYVIENKGSKLFLVTNLNAPNRKIVTVDAANPSVENWHDFIEETENVLSPSTGGGYFFAEYMQDAVSTVKQYDYEGNLVRDVKLPGVGSVGGLVLKKKKKNFTTLLPITSLQEVFINMILKKELQNYIENQKLISTQKSLKVNKCFSPLKMVQKYL